MIEIDGESFNLIFLIFGCFNSENILGKVNIESVVIIGERAAAVSPCFALKKVLVKLDDQRALLNYRKGLGEVSTGTILTHFQR